MPIELSAVHVFKWCRSFLLSAVGVAFVMADAGAWSEPRDTWRSSCFAYRDINGSGRFDMGDRPYAGLLVEMLRPDGAKTSSEANIDGFVNFEMVPGDPVKGHIISTGRHELIATPPEGWKGNDQATLSQQLEFVAHEKAGSYMVPDKPCEHIGVTADHTVSGRIDVVPGTETEDIALVARHQSDDPVDVTLDAAGNFRFPAVEGDYSLTLSNTATGRSATREFSVGSYSLILSAISLKETPRAALSGPKMTATFDDLLTTDSLFEIPAGYAGLDWKYWIATHNRFYGGWGYVNGTVSGEYIAYNSSGVPATISRATPFDFIGVHVSAAWPRGREADLIVKAWRGGLLVHEDRMLISNAGPSFFLADYRSVDRIEFSQENYERIVLDDLVFRD